MDNETRSAIQTYPTPTVQRPSWEEIERQVMCEAGCEATDGCWVEADGVCEHGHASWLMYLGGI